MAMITNAISQNAVKVRLMLLCCEEIPVEELFEMCGLTIVDFYLALGWLTREGRVIFYTRDGRLTVEMVCLGNSSLASAQGLMSD